MYTLPSWGKKAEYQEANYLAFHRDLKYLQFTYCIQYDIITCQKDIGAAARNVLCLPYSESSTTTLIPHYREDLLINKCSSSAPKYKSVLSKLNIDSYGIWHVSGQCWRLVCEHTIVLHVRLIEVVLAT